MVLKGDFNYLAQLNPRMLQLCPQQISFFQTLLNSLQAILLKCQRQHF